MIRRPPRSTPFPTRRSSDLDHHLVAEDEPEVELIGRHFDPAVAARHAREHEHAVLAERLHALEDDGRKAGRLEDEVERAVTLRPDRKSTRLNSSHANISYAV